MSRLLGAATVSILVVVGCAGSSAPPRPQLVVVLDTDMPVVDQIRSRPDLSNDAAVDSVRIDVFDAKGVPSAFLDLTAADPLDWPVSFGVAAEGRAQVRLRVRVFRAQHAAAGELDGVQTLEPDAAATIDRIVDVTLPTTGVTRVEIVLTGDCLGVKPSFAEPARNCVDSARSSVSPAEGVTALGDAAHATRVGTWSRAKEVPCSKPSDDARICVAGGFTLLGDAALKGFSDGVIVRLGSAPLKPVVLSPFYLDKTEVTVAAFDAVRTMLTGPMPARRDTAAASTTYCTWLGGAAGTESLPINCILRKTAAEYCALRGGALPSEAQWEHAARGRGQQRVFPWGGAQPTCCITAAGCPSTGPEPVGSHVGGSCGGIGDVSRDGVLDMGGSLSEHTLDALAEYSDPCWQGAAVLMDPVCTVAAATTFVSRGSAWKRPAWAAVAALRPTDLSAQLADDVGFRCAYPDVAP